MEKLIMERATGDNKYLHRDFHISGDIGIAYVGENFGEAAVKEYLRDFALSYFALLISDIKEQGLLPLKEYIESIYHIEEADDACELTLDKDSLRVHINYCPAVKFMLSQSHTPSIWYKYTTSVVYAELAKAAGLGFVMENYDDATGKTAYTFTKEVSK